MATTLNELEKASKKWKAWLAEEYRWQQKVRTEVNRLQRAAGIPRGPTELPAPPKPPFK